MIIGIFTCGTSVRSKNICTDISRYPTGKHEIKNPACHHRQIQTKVVDKITCKINPCLTLSQIPDKDSSKLKGFADDIFTFDENGRKLYKPVENAVGKEEIACYEQFLLFPQCFQKDLYYRQVKTRLV